MEEPAEGALVENHPCSAIPGPPPEVLVDHQAHASVLTGRHDRSALTVVTGHRLLTEHRLASLGSSSGQLKVSIWRGRNVDRVDVGARQQIVEMLDERHAEPAGDGAPLRRFKVPEATDLGVANLRPSSELHVGGVAGAE